MLGLTRLNPNIWWYFARAGGLVAWGLLAASVFSGLIYAGRLTRKVPPPAWNLDIHRFLGGLSVVFVAIHVSALMADKYVNFGLSQVLVPFAGHWRPGAVAWGITAMYLLLAVEVTSLAMRWLPRRLWRTIHYLSFLLFAFSTVHAIQTGTDAANPLAEGVGVCLLAAASVAAALRLARARRRTLTRRRLAPSPAPVARRSPGPGRSRAGVSRPHVSPATAPTPAPPRSRPVSAPLLIEPEDAGLRKVPALTGPFQAARRPYAVRRPDDLSSRPTPSSAGQGAAQAP